MEGSFSYSDWFVRYWSRAALPAAAVLIALSPLVARGLDTAALMIFFHLPFYMIHQHEEHAAGRFKEFATRVIGDGREILDDCAICCINIVGVWIVNLFARYAAVEFGPGWGWWRCI